jgi:predicted peroxiredoxin
MASNGKVVINLATGLEDPERVTIAFLVAVPAAEQGKQVVFFLTKEAVRLAVSGVAEVVACDGCPPLSRLFQQFADAGGQLFVCPICVTARKIDDSTFVPNAKLAGATPLWEWVGAEGATVFSY